MFTERVRVSGHLSFDRRQDIVCSGNSVPHLGIKSASESDRHTDIWEQSSCGCSLTSRVSRTSAYHLSIFTRRAWRFLLRVLLCGRTCLLSLRLMPLTHKMQCLGRAVPRSVPPGVTLASDRVRGFSCGARHHVHAHHRARWSRLGSGKPDLDAEHTMGRDVFHFWCTADDCDEAVSRR